MLINRILNIQLYMSQCHCNYQTNMIIISDGYVCQLYRLLTKINSSQCLKLITDVVIVDWLTSHLGFWNSNCTIKYWISFTVITPNNQILKSKQSVACTVGVDYSTWPYLETNNWLQKLTFLKLYKQKVLKLTPRVDCLNFLRTKL